MTDTPALSVISLLGNQRARAQVMLDSLLAQPDIDRMEIILVECVDGQIPLEGSDHPAVQVITAKPGAHFGSARAYALRSAHATIAAFVEEHSWVLPGWSSAVIEAHEQGWVGVGPQVVNGCPDQGISNGLALWFYPHSQPPVSIDETGTLAGQNSSYRRDVLLEFGPDLDDLLLAEIVLQWELRKKGHKLVIDPRVQLAHRNEISVAAITKGLYVVNKLLGPVRAKYSQWSLLDRALRILAAPLNPWLRTLRLAMFYWRNRPHLTAEMARNLPLYIWLDHISVAGQTSGLLFGAGRSPVRFLHYETCEPARGVILPYSSSGSE